MKESYKTFEEIDFSKDPFEMTTTDIRSELQKIMPLLKDNYSTAYCSAIIARIEHYQNELTRQNIEDGSKSAAKFSKWAISIAVISLIVTLISFATSFNGKP
jgi:hypothetical protein